jgi:enoyl-CoA hydratase/carnithine racemase
MLSARTFGAAEAKELGVVNHICPPDQVLAEAMAYAKDLAANVSPASMATIKRQIQRHLTMSIDEAVADTMELMKESLVGPDFNEGVHSYLDKRQPEFSPLGEGTQFTWMR